MFKLGKKSTVLLTVSVGHVNADVVQPTALWNIRNPFVRFCWLVQIICHTVRRTVYKCLWKNNLKRNSGSGKCKIRLPQQKQTEDTQSKQNSPNSLKIGEIFLNFQWGYEMGNHWYNRFPGYSRSFRPRLFNPIWWKHECVKIANYRTLLVRIIQIKLLGPFCLRSFATCFYRTFFPIEKNDSCSCEANRFVKTWIEITYFELHWNNKSICSRDGKNSGTGKSVLQTRGTWFTGDLTTGKPVRGWFALASSSNIMKKIGW